MGRRQALFQFLIPAYLSAVFATIWCAWTFASPVKSDVVSACVFTLVASLPIVLVEIVAARNGRRQAFANPASPAVFAHLLIASVLLGLKVGLNPLLISHPEGYVLIMPTAQLCLAGAVGLLGFSLLRRGIACSKAQVRTMASLILKAAAGLFGICSLVVLVPSRLLSVGTWEAMALLTGVLITAIIVTLSHLAFQRIAIPLLSSTLVDKIAFLAVVAVFLSSAVLLEDWMLSQMHENLSWSNHSAVIQSASIADLTRLVFPFMLIAGALDSPSISTAGLYSSIIGCASSRCSLAVLPHQSSASICRFTRLPNVTGPSR